MKKILLSLLIVLPLVSFAGQKLNTKDQVNQVLAEILQPFNNPVTKAMVKFSKLRVSSKRVLDMKMNSLFWKIGSENELAINFDHVDYSYNKGVQPSLDFNFGFKVDLLKIVGQDMINDLEAEIEETVTDFVKQSTAEYGAAVTAQAKVTSKTKDKAGNLIAIAFSLAIDLDMSKLPADVSIADTPLVSGKADIAISIDGGKVKVKTIINPKYSGFADDGLGLKEVIDGLKTRDQDMMYQFINTFQMIDEMADNIVNNKNIIMR